MCSWPCGTLCACLSWSFMAPGFCGFTRALMTGSWSGRLLKTRSITCWRRSKKLIGTRSPSPVIWLLFLVTSLKCMWHVSKMMFWLFWPFGSRGLSFWRSDRSFVGTGRWNRPRNKFWGYFWHLKPATNCGMEIRQNLRWFESLERSIFYWAHLWLYSAWRLWYTFSFCPGGRIGYFPRNKWTSWSVHNARTS